MKKLPIIFLLASMITIGGVCSTEEKNCALPPGQFRQLYETRKGILIDVRSLQEYDTAHIAGAINITFSNMDFVRTISTLDRQKEYFLYCRKGLRSEKAREIMTGEGFKKVCTLQGGLEAWLRAGYPVINNVMLSIEK